MGAIGCRVFCPFCLSNQEHIGTMKVYIYCVVPEEVGSRSLARSARAANSIPRVVDSIVYAYIWRFQAV